MCCASFPAARTNSESLALASCKAQCLVMAIP